jgi:hypothetical protein
VSLNSRAASWISGMRSRMRPVTNTVPSRVFLGSDSGGRGTGTPGASRADRTSRERPNARLCGLWQQPQVLRGAGRIGCHLVRAATITTRLGVQGTPENAQPMVGHESLHGPMREMARAQEPNQIKNAPGIRGSQSAVPHH